MINPIMSNYQLYCGDCLDMMRGMEDNSINAIVTDPPYGLKFMGRKWDYDVPSVEIWAECLRVLKPGGHLLAFAGTRTQHRMAVRIEDAGFEIRDMIAWVYGSGFPKSLDISKALDREAGAERCSGEREWSGGKRSGGISHGGTQKGTNTRIIYDTPATEAAQQWQGWGTALKPAFEPITLARKPISESTVASNVLEWGTGGLNIDACRIGTDEELGRKCNVPPYANARTWSVSSTPAQDSTGKISGRWPANFVHDGSEEVVALFPVTGMAKSAQRGQGKGKSNCYGGESAIRGHDDNGGSAARFFYTAKADKADRNEGANNNHPTVKPEDLMVWLCKLVTPPGGTILDPFCGSGSTGKAAMICGFDFIGIDIDPQYIDIARARIEAKDLPLLKEIREVEKQPEQTPLFSMA